MAIIDVTARFMGRTTLFFAVFIGVCGAYTASANENPASVHNKPKLPHRNHNEHDVYQNEFPMRIGTTPPPPLADTFETTSIPRIVEAAIVSTTVSAGLNEEEKKEEEEEEEEEDEEKRASARKNQQKINDLMLDMLAASVGGKVVIEPWE